MKALSLLVFTVLIGVGSAFADSFEIVRDGQSYTCNPNGGSGPSAGLCAEASLEKKGYVISDCARVQNYAQDICAAASLRKKDYVMSDCLRLEAGGQCAVTSIALKNSIISDCFRISNDAQDRCAAASLRKKGYVTSDCLRL